MGLVRGLVVFHDSVQAKEVSKVGSFGEVGRNSKVNQLPRRPAKSGGESKIGKVVMRRWISLLGEKRLRYFLGSSNSGKRKGIDKSIGEASDSWQHSCMESKNLLDQWPIMSA
eukprot:TRINITY_DN4751_c0_g2_i1.p1 TRINITY_DN4751_c0_g2~~TRINITY_DN4751_c0_g2_i1.p1  ORF type:complete len:113 (-),score=14.72 TRINITY_DN4751_c0_g2_i1:307-645(-)